MQTLPVKYSELRSTTVSVIEFLKSEYWWEDNSNLKTIIEDDLGITGDDASELMEKFSTKFNVDLAGFNFMKFFSPEGVDPIALLLIPPFIIALLVALVKYSMVIFAYVFSNKLYRWLLKFKTRSIIQRAAQMLEREGKGTLTVGDLVASAVCGQFVSREDMMFRLI